MADEHKRQRENTQKRGFSTDERVGTHVDTTHCWSKQKRTDRTVTAPLGAEPGNGYRDSLANIAVDGKQRP